MQISNPVLSQFLGSTLNRTQQPDRRPVIIEGQLVDDNQTKKSAKLAQENSATDSNSQFALDSVQGQQEEEQQGLIRPVQASSSNSEVGLIEPQLIRNPSQLNTSAQSNPDSEQGFPFGNRRSFNGLAGSSLIIQNYLNNTSASNPQSGNIDFFV